MDNSLAHALVGNIGGYLFFGLVAFIFVIFVGREIACWYFKINDMKKLLEQIEENTRTKGIIHDPLEK